VEDYIIIYNKLPKLPVNQQFKLNEPAMREQPSAQKLKSSCPF